MRVHSKLGLALVAAVLVAAPVVASAAVPTTVPVQGVLSDGAGVPLDGARTVRFRIYSAATGGSPLHDETDTVTCASGVFTTYLGETTTLDAAIFTGQPLWLGITVGSDAEMTPRLKIGSVPYAMSAGDSSSLGGVAAASYLTTSSQSTIEGWATGVCYNTQSELTTALAGVYAPAAHTHNGSTIVDDSLTAADLAADSVGASELANNAVDTAAIADGAVTGPKLAPCGANQIYKYNGASWGCVADSVGDITDLTGGAGITITNGATSNPTIGISAGGVTDAMVSGIDASKIASGTLANARYDAQSNMLNINKLARGTLANPGNTTTCANNVYNIAGPFVVLTPNSGGGNTYCVLQSITNTGFCATCYGAASTINWIAMY